MASPSYQGSPGLSRRGLLAGAGGAGVLALLAACDAAGSEVDRAAPAGGPARRGGILRAGSPPPPTAVDPVTMYDGSAIAIVQLVAEYLIWIDRDFRLVPKLALSWSAEQDGKRWTFRLRSGVTFSDGTPLDPTAVKATFDRLLDPKNKSAARSAFETILSPGGVSVVDSAHVAFTLDRSFSDFPYLVSAGNYNAVILKSDYAGTFTEHAIGTGPFVLKSYDSATGASFGRNEKYWDGDKPYLDGVEIKFYADDQADLLALQSGEIDAQILSRPALAEPLGAAGAVTVNAVKGTGVTVLTLRVDQPPFDRKEVRQAVAYGLARPDILQSIGTGVGDLGNAVHLDQRSSTDFYGGDQSKDTPWLFTTANLVGWAGRPVPSELISPMVKSRAVWNGSKYANPALDAAADAYDLAATDVDRKVKAAVIAQILYEDVPIVVTYWAGAVRAYNGTKFDGIQANPSSYVDFSGVSQR